MKALAGITPAQTFRRVISNPLSGVWFFITFRSITAPMERGVRGI